MAQYLQLIQKVSLLAFLVGSMLALGLSLGWRPVLVPLRNFRLVLQALGLNFILAPLFAWLLTLAIPLNQGHAAGLMLLGGAAGAPFLPKLACIAHGDAALAVGLVVLLTLGTIVLLPLALPYLVPGVKADPWAVARPMVLAILAPLVAGMVIRSVAPSVAGSAAPVFTWIGNMGLLALFVLLIGMNMPALLHVLGSGAIAASVLYVVGLFGLSLSFAPPATEMRGVLALATSARNFGAAMVPAADSMTNSDVMVMLIVSAIVGLVLTFAAAGWLRGRTTLGARN